MLLEQRLACSYTDLLQIRSAVTRCNVRTLVQKLQVLRQEVLACSDCRRSLAGVIEQAQFRDRLST